MAIFVIFVVSLSENQYDDDDDEVKITLSVISMLYLGFSQHI